MTTTTSRRRARKAFRKLSKAGLLPRGATFKPWLHGMVKTVHTAYAAIYGTARGVSA
jgi:hypothetical protein